MKVTVSLNVYSYHNTHHKEYCSALFPFNFIGTMDLSKGKML